MADKVRDNAGQAALWNGPAGRSWVETQPLLDAMFAPFEAMLADAATAARPRSVLDIGCGTGAVTLAIARALGPGAQCQGLDISAPMIAAARGRAAQQGIDATFLCADAQNHRFPRRQAERIVSRFGVMFFDDPVRAFANLHEAAAPGATLHAIAWRSPGDNPFMTTAERAAAPLLPTLPARQPGSPGQFAFADPLAVRAILTASGWREAVLAPIDLSCTFPVSALEAYFTRLGPLGLALDTLDAATRRRVVEAVRPAFAPFLEGDTVRFLAACWSVTARA